MQPYLVSSGFYGEVVAMETYLGCSGCHAAIRGQKWLLCSHTWTAVVAMQSYLGSSGCYGVVVSMETYLGCSGCYRDIPHGLVVAMETSLNSSCCCGNILRQ